MTPAGLLAAALVVLTTLAAGHAVDGHRSAALVTRLGAGAPHAGAAGPGWWRRPPVRLRAVLDDAALPGGATRAWRAWSGLAAPVTLLSLAAGGLPLAALAGLGWVAGPTLVVVGRRGASGRAVEAALPDALEAMARSLRSGAATRQALDEVAEVTPGALGHELRAVSRSLASGSTLEAALGSFAHRRPEPGVRLAVAALLLGAEAGGAHARALDGVAASVRARLGVAREVRALSSQARLSAVVIGAAPVAFGLLAAGTDGAGTEFLLRTPLGLGCLTLGLGLDGVGAVWMHRLAQVEA